MGMAVRAAVVAALATLISGVAAGQAAETSSGSGVVIAAKGEILTNAHVVEACQTITVNLASGNSETGVLVARDERNDLAVVRLTGTNNPPASVAVFPKAPRFALAMRLSRWAIPFRAYWPRKPAFQLATSAPSQALRQLSLCSDQRARATRQQRRTTP